MPAGAAVPPQPPHGEGLSGAVRATTVGSDGSGVEWSGMGQRDRAARRDGWLAG